MPAPNYVQFINLSECQLHAFEEAKVAVDHFADVLVRKAIAINSKVEAESVINVIKNGGLSWKMVKNQRKNVVVQRLRAIENLDESQCNELFDKMDQTVPVDRDTQRRNCIVERKWIMKCTCCLFACLLYQVTPFCCLPVIGKVSPEDVGGEEILKGIKSDIVKFQFPLSQTCFCKAPLHRLLFNRHFNDWRCSSCFAIQSGRVHFQCSKSDCIYKITSSCDYRVCSSCFEWAMENNGSYEMDEKRDEAEDTFIYRQINRCIVMIS